MNQDSRRKEYRRQLSKSGLFDIMSQTADQNQTAKQNQTTERDIRPEDTDQDIIESVIDNVLAPVLNEFVVWVLHRAMEEGIKRLYFLARDGYLMYRAAVKYVEAYGLPVACRYLYCSRYSVRIPAYHLDEEKALSYITLGGLEVTPEKIYQRAGMSAKQRALLYQTRILPYGNRQLIPRREFAQVRETLKGSSLFMEFLRRNSRKALPAYEQYLIQEGLLEKTESAIVDSGWVGSMQKELNEMLKRLGRETPISGFYWGLYEIPCDVERGRYFTYFFSPESSIRRKVVFNNCLFETIFTAPHGMTLFYRECGEKTEPVLSEMQKERAERLILMEKRFAAWQKAFLRQREKDSFEELARACGEKRSFRAVAKSLELFMHRPTREEARVFGGMEFTDDVLEVKERHVTVSFSMRQSAWYEGNVSAGRRYPRCHIALYTVYKYLLYSRMRRRYMRREHIK